MLYLGPHICVVQQSSFPVPRGLQIPCAYNRLVEPVGFCRYGKTERNVFSHLKSISLSYVRLDILLSNPSRSIIPSRVSHLKPSTDYSIRKKYALYFASDAFIRGCPLFKSSWWRNSLGRWEASVCREFGIKFMKQNEESNLRARHSYAQSAKYSSLHPLGGPNRSAQILGEVHIVIPFEGSKYLWLAQNYFVMGLLGMQGQFLQLVHDRNYRLPVFHHHQLH
jgi:hypothetical protein